MRRTEAHVNRKYQQRSRHRAFRVAVVAFYPHASSGFNIFAKNDE